MKLFRAEAIADLPSATIKKCRFCGEDLEHVGAMIESDTGRTIQIFECKCGERTWED